MMMVVEEDENYSRLSSLYEKFEEYQEKNRMLEKTQAARDELAVKEAFSRIDIEWRSLQNDYDSAMRDFEKSRVSGNEDEIRRCTGQLKYISDCIAIRRTPWERAKAQWEALARNRSLSADEDPEGLIMEDVDFYELQKDVVGYKEEFLRLYKLCESIEQDNQGEEERVNTLS